MKAKKGGGGKLLFHFLSGAIALLAIVGASGPALAQTPAHQWSTPQGIPGYGPGTSPPYLVADQNRTVHAFGSMDINGEVAGIYSQWGVDRGWSAPVDILLSPRAGIARIRGACLDAQGVMHLAFYGGNEQGADIYYSRAATINAGRAPAWSRPKLVGKDANPAAALAGDDDGNLFIVYSGLAEGNGLYAVYSSDAGDTWSQPTVISLTHDADIYPGTIAVHLDGQRQLHVVWSVWRPPYGGEALYYAHMDVDREQWSRPITISKPGVGESGSRPDYAVILTYHNVLFVIYHEFSPAGLMTKWMRQSSDNGRTWTDPVRPFTNPFLVGGNGAAVLLVDSHDTMHAVIANRAGDCCHGMWHSVWQDDQWSEARYIVMGPKTPEFDPTTPTAIVSQGNVILATWISEGSPSGVWYSYITLDTPELPIVPLPTPTARAVPRTSTPTAALPVPTVAPWVSHLSAEVPVELSSPGLSVWLGALPALVLIAFVILGQVRR